MNKNQTKGRAQNLKGRAREAVGFVTGSRVTMIKGAIDRAKGALREKVGDAEQAVAGKGKHSGEE